MLRIACEAIAKASRLGILRSPEEVRATLPVHPLERHELQVGLVDQGRRVERVIGSLGDQLPVGHPSELLVDEWEEGVEGGTVASCEGGEELGDVGLVVGVMAPITP